eukprot:4779929-Ditylum_brightwellii.AAC.1
MSNNENSLVHAHNLSNTKDEEHRRDVSIRGVWQCQTDTIIEIRVTDSDTKLCCNRTIENHLKAQEKEKKKKYLYFCQENCKNFVPFVVTVDG